MYRYLMNLSDYLENVPGFIALLAGMFLAVAVFTLFINPLHNVVKYTVVKRCGENSFEEDGYYTLSPRVHFHLIGFISNILLNINFTQPVYYDSEKIKHPKVSTVLISLSGLFFYFGIFLVSGIGYSVLKYCGFLSVSVASIMPRSVEWYVYVYYAFFVAVFYLFRISTCTLILSAIPFGPLDLADILYMFMPVNWSDVLRNNESLISLVLFVFLFLTVGAPDGLINNWADKIMLGMSNSIMSMLSAVF